jgi:hypothetical protein
MDPALQDRRIAIDMRLDQAIGNQTKIKRSFLRKLECAGLSFGGIVEFRECRYIGGRLY